MISREGPEVDAQFCSERRKYSSDLFAGQESWCYMS